MVSEIPSVKDCLLKLVKQCLQQFYTHPQIRQQQIELCLLRGQFPITYQSAIALPLATQFNQPAITIATRIVTQIQSESTESFLCPNSLRLGDEQPNFTSQAMPSGMIILELTDVGLANWLHCIANISAVPGENLPQFDFPNDLFDIQYSHARCCSLLRRAHREGIITLTSLPSGVTQPPWQWYAPNPLPWLSPTRRLQLIHAAEHLLIAQLIKTVDAYSITSSAPDWTQLAEDLSQKFQQFYRCCQIWGIVKQQTPQLAQARLGLVWITQKLLQSILQEQLHIIAPFEL